MTAPTPNPRRSWDPRVWLLTMAAALAGFGATIAVVWAAQFNVPDPATTPVLLPLDVEAACERLYAESSDVLATGRSDRPGWICSHLEGPSTSLDPTRACELLYGADVRPIAPMGTGTIQWWCLTDSDQVG